MNDTQIVSKFVSTVKNYVKTTDMIFVSAGIKNPVGLSY